MMMMMMITIRCCAEELIEWLGQCLSLTVAQYTIKMHTSSRVVRGLWILNKCCFNNGHLEIRQMQWFSPDPLYTCERQLNTRGCIFIHKYLNTNKTHVRFIKSMTEQSLLPKGLKEIFRTMQNSRKEVQEMRGIMHSSKF